jgi:alpha-galactosidase
MDNAIRAVSSSVLYEVSMDPLNPTYNQVAWGGAVGGSTTLVGSDGGNMTFTSMMTQVDAVNGLPRCGAPGCWNFIDLLGVGNGILTDDEGNTNMAMWAMFASPLMASIDLTAPPSSPTLATLKNVNIIAIDQDPLGIMGAQRTSVSCGSATCQTYSRPIQAGGAAWAALNRSSTTQSITITFTGTLNFYDLVAGSSIGAETGTYTPSVVSHGTAMFAACAGATNWNASTHKCQ